MLNKTTLTALGAALIALGQELQGASAEETPGTETPTTTRRGRSPAKTVITEAGTGLQPSKTTTVETVPGAGKPESELRELIKPLVEEGKGAEVKALIAKHGGTKLSDLPATAHAAFIKDIEALSI